MPKQITTEDIVDEEKAKQAALATVNASSGVHDKPPVVTIDDRLATERSAYQTDANAYKDAAVQGGLRLDQLSNLGGAGPTYKMPAAGGNAGTPADRYAEQLQMQLSKVQARGDSRVAANQGSYGSWRDGLQGISDQRLAGLGQATAAGLTQDAQRRALSNRVGLAQGTTAAQSAELSRLRAKQGADRQAYDEQYNYQVKQQLKAWDEAMAALEAAGVGAGGGGGGGGGSGSGSTPGFSYGSQTPISSAVDAYGNLDALPGFGRKPSGSTTVVRLPGGMSRRIPTPAKPKAPLKDRKFG